MSEGREQGQQPLWAEGEGPALAPEPPAGDSGPKPAARFQPVNRQQMVWRWTWSACWSPTTWRGRFGK